MEENEKQYQRPMMTFGPGMRIWLLLALYFACVGILQLLSRSQSLAWLVAGPDDGYPGYMARIALAVGGVVMFAVPALVVANVFPPERFRWFRLDKPVSPVILLVAALAMITAILGFDQIEAWISNSISNPDFREYEKLVEKQSAWEMNLPTVGDLVGSLFLNALAPAICEELFFRGALQQMAIEWTKKSHVGIFLAAFFFALVHFDVSAFPVLLVAGLMLGYAFYWTGSLRTTVIMHFMFNAFSVVEIYMAQHSKAVKDWNPPVALTMGGLVLSGLFIFLVWKLSAKKQAL